MTANKVRSVCPYCGVGCGIVMDTDGTRILKVSGDKTHPTNFGRLCTKGNTSWQAVAAPGRLEHAYLRTERTQEPVRANIDDAISHTAHRLRAILDAHGPDAIAFYVSGQMSLESQYLANKLAKGFIGTKRVESNSRLCMASAGSGYKLSLGVDGPPGSYEDFDQADVFFVIGANMADCHPILFLRMMDRVKQGAKLIVVDPPRGECRRTHAFESRMTSQLERSVNSRRSAGARSARFMPLTSAPAHCGGLPADRGAVVRALDRGDGVVREFVLRTDLHRLRDRDALDARAVRAAARDRGQLPGVGAQRRARPGGRAARTRE